MIPKSNFVNGIFEASVTPHLNAASDHTGGVSAGYGSGRNVVEDNGPSPNYALITDGDTGQYHATASNEATGADAHGTVLTGQGISREY